MTKNDLFKAIVKSYRDNDFKEKVTSLLQENENNKELLARTISVLCGVEINYSSTEAYVCELEKAIKNYSSKYKVVSKVKTCSMSCLVSEGKTNCQKACHFDAIVVDDNNHTTIMVKDRCIDCGFCVDACPNNCYMDKVEFVPLLSLLQNNICEP